MSRLRLLRASLCASLALLVLSACTDKSDDDLGEFSWGPECEEVSATDLGRSDVSSLGFSADDVLAFAEGEHEASIAWAPANEGPELDVTPSSGTTELALTVRYEGGAIRNVEKGYYVSADGQGGYAQTDDCADSLEIDVTVHLKSENGAFDDTFPAKLVAVGDDVATMRIAFELAQLEGSFGVSVVEPKGATVDDFDIEATFGAGRFEGAITGSVIDNTPHGLATLVTYAAWP